MMEQAAMACMSAALPAGTIAIAICAASKSLSASISSFHGFGVTFRWYSRAFLIQRRLPRLLSGSGLSNSHRSAKSQAAVFAALAFTSSAWARSSARIAARRAGLGTAWGTFGAIAAAARLPAPATLAAAATVRKRRRVGSRGGNIMGWSIADVFVGGVLSTLSAWVIGSASFLARVRLVGSARYTSASRLL